jgi:hypothetical protein
MFMTDNFFIFLIFSKCNQMKNFHEYTVEIEMETLRLNQWAYLAKQRYYAKEVVKWNTSI